ncbi:DUF1766-domain-containing protein [Xylona heveae TC161]|uniref:DUF1766-domain-containing protein n=1 Tax=Xylona heveae (strain CBS 132557 / TC161) TaxID=1328760 RepID=A0A164ZII2_XYLHT|nr:DUF1766-domain-containing protein [Xylona heveae TC161]KZF19142.1 DUF1766-domain-containing protein [Xylona heveae TC161]
MPFIPHTPESLLSLARSDSKNPATTCRGITSNGRPCRRSLAASSTPGQKNGSVSPGRGTSPGAKGSSNEKNLSKGVLAVLSNGTGNGVDAEDVAAFFCWQHKDQAAQYAQRLAETYGSQTRPGKKPGKHASSYSAANGNKPPKMVPVHQRTSIDTLIERIHGVDISDGGAHRPQTNGTQNHHQRPSKSLSSSWEKPSTSRPPRPSNSANTQNNAHRPSKPQSHGLLSILCCILSDKHYDEPAPRPSSRPSSRPHQPQNQNHHAPTSKPPQPQHYHTKPSHSSHPPRPDIQHMPSSQTEHYLSFIPRTLPPQTASLLLSEIAKPISPNDEDGYIYIFWLTNGESHTPSGAAAQGPAQSRRKAQQSAKTILLKIGRAKNVHRRMNEWSRQCNYDLTLVRYYPYVPTTGSADLLPPPSFPPSSSRSMSRSDPGLSSAPRHNPDHDHDPYSYPYPYTPTPSGQVNPSDPSSLFAPLFSVNTPYASPASSPYYPPPHSSPYFSPSPYPPSSNIPSSSPSFAAYNTSPYTSPPPPPPPPPDGPLERSYVDATSSSPSATANALSSGTSTSNSNKVPHAHRVERLIHIELGAQRVTNRGACAQCGREHREWFEVEASRDGLRRVDEVIRRWVRWAEGTVA